MAKGPAPPRPPPAAPYVSGVRTRDVPLGMLPIAFIAGVLVTLITVLLWGEKLCRAVGSGF